MPVLGTGAGIPLIWAISLHTPGLSSASCTPHPLQDRPAQLTPSKLAGEDPRVAHSGLSACTRRLFTLKPTDSSSERHHGVLCSGLGALVIGGSLPLLSRETREVIPAAGCCASSSLPRPWPSPPQNPLSVHPKHQPASSTQQHRSDKRVSKTPCLRASPKPGGGQSHP